jgi:hypothetical protein
MPIRINLLAEAQALEEQRRRNPVKRAIWLGVFLVCLILVWSSFLYLKGIIAKGELARINGQITSRSAAFTAVTENKARLDEATQKLAALLRLATNRFLNGNVLNALQQATVDDVQLARFRTDQKYEMVEVVKPKKQTNITEHITLLFEARDGGANPGDKISRFKQVLATHPFFLSNLDSTNDLRLTSYQPPQFGPDGKSFVPFTLECRLPEKTR